MNEITVKIKWDDPKEENWLNADNVGVALSDYCMNTNFVVEEVEKRYPSEVTIDVAIVERKIDGVEYWEAISVYNKSDLPYILSERPIISLLVSQSEGAFSWWDLLPHELFMTLHQVMKNPKRIAPPTIQLTLNMDLFA